VYHNKYEQNKDAYGTVITSDWRNKSEHVIDCWATVYPRICVIDLLELVQDG
jgi:hypothetical protein